MKQLLRWLSAQKSEQMYWILNKERTISKQQIDGKKKETLEILHRLLQHSNLNNGSRYLQIGPGAYDVINFLEGQCHSIHPLLRFYKRFYKKLYEECLTSDVFYIQGVGELLPYQSETFDVVILNNVLNHTQSPKAVIAETLRVTRRMN